MPPLTTPTRRTFATILTLTLLSSSLAYDLSLCSGSNTAADSQAVTDLYNSAGKCHDLCLSTSAFAVVQGKSCWCSDYAPAGNVSMSKCDTTCPGWPPEYCSSGSAGVFGYIALSIKPAGTQGAATISKPTSSESEPSPSTIPPSLNTVTVQATATVTHPISVSIVSIIHTLSDTPSPPSTTTSSKKSKPTPTTTTTSSSSSWSPTPYVSVKTVQGSAQTITITPSQPPQAAHTAGVVSESNANHSFFDSPGKVAGTFIAVALIVLSLIGAVVFLLLRRRRNGNKATALQSIDEEPASNGAPYMVDRTGRRSNLTLATKGLGLTRGSSNEKSPENRTPGSLSRRGSIPLHDQRLNPAALWSNSHTNGSHASVASFRDDQDYSRPVLHVRNPDQD